MKYLPPLFALLLPACTMLDARSGRYFTSADNRHVRLDFANGQITHYECESNLHSPIVRAHWHGLNNLAGQAAGFAAGPEAGAGVAGLTSLVNRPTSRPVGTAP